MATRTPRSLTTIDELLAGLEKTRQTGIALDIEEHAEDVCAIAMEVKLGLIGRYAVAIPVPARRLHETILTLHIALKETVRVIGERYQLVKSLARTCSNNFAESSAGA